MKYHFNEYDMLENIPIGLILLFLGLSAVAFVLWLSIRGDNK